MKAINEWEKTLRKQRDILSIMFLFYLRLRVASYFIKSGEGPGVYPHMGSDNGIARLLSTSSYQVPNNPVKGTRPETAFSSCSEVREFLQRPLTSVS